MGSKTNQQDNGSTNCFENLGQKLGVVLSRVKDTIFKDFLDGLVKDGSYEEFQTKYKDPNFKALEQFVNAVITKIGYDISGASESKELYNLIVSIIDASTSLSEKISDLFGGNGISFDQLISELPDGDKKNDEDSSSGKLIRFEDLLKADLNGSSGIKFGSEEFGGSIELDGSNHLKRLKAIFELIQELFDLFKKFSDIEWNKIAAEGSDFGNFIRQNYVTEEFVKRLIDYVLITFLKNARDVFADDLEQLLEQGKENLENVLKNKIKEFDVSQFEKLFNTFEQYKDKLKDVENLLKGKIEDVQQIADSVTNVVKNTKSLYSTAQSSIESIADQLPTNLSKEQLESYKKILLQKIDVILDQIVPDYNAAAKVMNRVYAVLDFLGVIGTKKIDLASYAHYLSIKDKSIDDIVDLDSVEVEIPSFHWNRVQKLFTKPSDYLQDVFPVKNHQDLENIIVKVTNLVSAFNKDIPQIDSIKQFIWELIIRINDKISTIANDMGTGIAADIEHIKAQLQSVKKFLLDLLKICEAIAIEVKNSLSNAFEEFADNIQTDATNLFNKLNGKIVAARNELSKLNIDETVKDVVIDSFKDAVTENLKDLSDFYDDTKIDAAIASFETEASDFWIGLNADTNEFVNSVKTGIKSYFNENTWQGKYNDFVAQIKTEFEKQTKNVPSSVEALKDFGIESLDSLLQGNGIKNPFSDFDFAAYYQIVVDNLSAPVELKIDTYSDAFKNYVKKIRAALKTLITNIGNGIDSVEFDSSRIEAIARDIIKSWWEKIKSRFMDSVVKPYADKLKKMAYEWIEDILHDVIDCVKGLVSGSPSSSGAKPRNMKKTMNKSTTSSNDSSLINLEDSIGKLTDSDLFGSDIDLEAIENVVTEIIALTDSYDADSWATWKSVIKLAVDVYKVIPKDVKKYITDLIDLPDFSAIENYLPEYSFDAKKKFLAVTVLDKKTSDSSGDAFGKAGITIQLLIFIGEKELEKNDENKDGTKAGESGQKETDSENKDEQSKEEKEEGIFILPVVKGNFDVNFNIGKTHCMSFSTNAGLNGSAEKKGNVVSKNVVGCFIKLTEKISETDIEWLADKGAADAQLKVSFERGQVDDMKEIKPLSGPDKILSIFDTKIASLSVENYPQTFFTGYKDSKFDIGYSCELKKLLLALKLREQNAFFKAILKKDIEIELEKLKLQYSLQKGFEVEDSLHIRIPINADVDLDMVKFKNIALDIGLDGSDLLANLLTSFTADLKGVAITFTEMGVGVDCKLPFNGHKGFDISPKFTYPNGLGISIDIDGVKGGGAVQWDKDRQRFAGALELTIMEKVGASAMLVFTTGKGTDPFSFMGALCVYFNPGIQLGMGFSLEGIGGSFGVNRMLDRDKLRDAVYDGTLESVLFFKDISKNIDKVLTNIDTYYPIKTGQMYFGFLGKLAWGAILKADFGLFIQAPKPVSVLIAGIIKVSVSEKADKFLVINASFLADLDFERGFSFDANLFDSKIVGIELYGSMVMRIFWGGDTKGFILSIGGFHPQYKPEEGFKIPATVKRIGMKLDYSILKMSLEAYFAITSNTVQFGTSLDMRIGWEKFGLFGYATFNALFQFKPFKFMVDVSAGLAVKVGSKKICSIDLAFALSGPAPWHAKGKASFWILFIKISVGFDKTWGKNQIASNRNRIDVLPLFTKEFSRKDNWKFISSDLTDNMVSLIKFEEADSVVQPSDSISFNQTAVPLQQIMECYGEDDLNDIQRLDISRVYIGDEAVEILPENSSFAPTLINRLDEKAKLARNSYEQMQGGFRLAAQSDVKNGYKDEFSPEYKKDLDLEYSSSEWESACGNIPENDFVETEDVKMEESAALGFATLYNASSEDDEQNKLYSKTQRCSHRRSSSGFDRFVRQWDEFLYAKTKAKVKNILDENNKTNEI